jgi:hypothetical protein
MGVLMKSLNIALFLGFVASVSPALARADALKGGYACSNDNHDILILLARSTRFEITREGTTCSTTSDRFDPTSKSYLFLASQGSEKSCDNVVPGKFSSVEIPDTLVSKPGNGYPLETTIMLNSVDRGEAVADEFRCNWVEPAPLKPCVGRSKISLDRWVAESRAEGASVKLMKNLSGQVVGMYAFGSDAEDARASVCGFDMPEDVVYAPRYWSYWHEEQGSPNPGLWSVENRLSIYQDEGFLNMRVLEASKDGNVRLAVTIDGTDEHGLSAAADTVTLSDL